MSEVDPNLTDAEFARASGDDGRTALHRATNFNRVEMIAVLIAEGANISARDDRGRTALHHAASSGHIKSIKTLIALGADVDARDIDGWTPLQSAVSHEQAKAVVVLLERGADIHTRDVDGCSPLHTASHGGSRAVTTLLLDGGVDVDVRIRKVPMAGGTPFDPYPSHRWIRPLVGWLLGGDDEKEQTPLHRAAAGGNVEVIDLLLERGADVNAVDARSRTPLHLAVMFRARESLTGLLLSRGADPSLRNDLGRTPEDRDEILEDRSRDLLRVAHRSVWVIWLFHFVTLFARATRRARASIAGGFARHRP